MNLYVNNFSLDIGETGTKAVNLLIKKAVDVGIISDEIKLEIKNATKFFFYIKSMSLETR